MVRLPASWRGAIAARPAQSGAGGPSPAARRITATPVEAFTRLVTVDLGNDGMAPQVLFNGAGQAWTFTGPQGLGESWALDQCYVSTSVGQLDSAEAFVYAGPYMQPYQPVAQYAVAANIAGGGNQFGMGGIAIQTGWFIVSYWTGGTPGAQANLRLTGTKTVLA